MNISFSIVIAFLGMFVTYSDACCCHKGSHKSHHSRHGIPVPIPYPMGGSSGGSHSSNIPLVITTAGK